MIVTCPGVLELYRLSFPVKKTIYCVTVVFGEIFIEQRRSEKVGANQAYGETGGD